MWQREEQEIDHANKALVEKLKRRLNGARINLELEELLKGEGVKKAAEVMSKHYYRVSKSLLFSRKKLESIA